MPRPGHLLLFTLILDTGLRRGEALALRWDDVDLDGCELNVRQSLKDVNGRLQFGKPKTASGERTVRLAPPVVAMLREHRKHQLAERLAAGPAREGAGEGGDLVLVTARGKPLRPRNVYRRLEQLIERSGLPPAGLQGSGARHRASLTRAPGTC